MSDQLYGVEWCREKIPGFRAMNDQVEKARQETEANRQKYAALCERGMRRFPEEKAQ